ncbi:MAG: hypothetical protein JRJ03_08275 [Deltaproteobacteria bacterium]|nr:hypothetical protein [Deltaproteobacteria bacterium]
MKDFKPISLENVRSYPLRDRKSKVRVDDMGRPWAPGGRLQEWLDSLPDILAARDFKRVVDRIIRAASSGRMIILGMGAHPIKVGLSPLIIDLMDRGVINAIAMNGAGIIHDAELAMVGHTSEDVAEQLQGGKFGMAEETGKLLNQAITRGARRNRGIGAAVGAMLVKENFPYNHLSLLASAFRREIPVTVHVALGTDIIHMHPSVDGASIGKASHLDFRIFAGLAARLEGGVYINLGSAVILPEVFLKALTLVRNLGHNVKTFTTVNMDFIRQYRPMTNVLDRPTLGGGEGYMLLGHHEIMFPLLAAAIIEGLESRKI